MIDYKLQIKTKKDKKKFFLKVMIFLIQDNL